MITAFDALIKFTVAWVVKMRCCSLHWIVLCFPNIETLTVAEIYIEPALFTPFKDKLIDMLIVVTPEFRANRSDILFILGRDELMIGDLICRSSLMEV